MNGYKNAWVAVLGIAMAGAQASPIYAQSYPSYPGMPQGAPTSPPYGGAGDYPAPYPSSGEPDEGQAPPYGSGATSSYPIPGTPKGGNIFEMLQDMQQRGRNMPSRPNGNGRSDGEQGLERGSAAYGARRANSGSANAAAWNVAEQRPYTNKADCEDDGEMRSRVGGGAAWTRYCADRFASASTSDAISKSGSETGPVAARNGASGAQNVRGRTLYDDHAEWLGSRTYSSVEECRKDDVGQTGLGKAHYEYCNEKFGITQEMQMEEDVKHSVYNISEFGSIKNYNSCREYIISYFNLNRRTYVTIWAEKYCAERYK